MALPARCNATLACEEANIRAHEIHAPSKVIIVLSPSTAGKHLQRRYLSIPRELGKFQHSFLAPAGQHVGEGSPRAHARMP